MRKHVHSLEPGEIEAHAIGKIGEGGAGKLVAALALEHRVELLAQSVQMQHVRRGIGELRLA